MIEAKNTKEERALTLIYICNLRHCCVAREFGNLCTMDEMSGVTVFCTTHETI